MHIIYAVESTMCCQTFEIEREFERQSERASEGDREGEGRERERGTKCVLYKWQ